MTPVEPQREINVHVKVSSSSRCWRASTSVRRVREEGTGCTFLVARVTVAVGVGRGCTEVRGHGLRVRSFPGVKALLELGARVADVEALLADCVVAMETDQHRGTGRVDPLSRP